MSVSPRRHRSTAISRVSAVNTNSPVLARSILNPLERAPHSVPGARAAQLCDWVLANIQLPKDVAKQLRDARAARKP